MQRSSVSPCIPLQFIIYHTIRRKVLETIKRKHSSSSIVLSYIHTYIHTLFGHILLPQLPTFVDFSRVNLANTCRQESYYICAKNANTNSLRRDSSLCTSTIITTTTATHSLILRLSHTTNYRWRKRKRGTERITFEEMVDWRWQAAMVRKTECVMHFT